MIRLVFLLLACSAAADNYECPGLCSCGEGQCTWPMYCSCHCDPSAPSCHCTPFSNADEAVASSASVQLEGSLAAAGGGGGGCHAACQDSFDCSSGFVCGGASVCCNGVSGVSCPCPGDILEDDGDNSFSGAAQQGNHSAIEI